MPTKIEAEDERSEDPVAHYCSMYAVTIPKSYYFPRRMRVLPFRVLDNFGADVALLYTTSPSKSDPFAIASERGNCLRSTFPTEHSQSSSVFGRRRDSTFAHSSGGCIFIVALPLHSSRQ